MTSAARFEGQVVLVTGASRGMGRATAERFAREGATVVVNYRRDAEAAAATLGAIEARGGRGLAIAADLEDGGAIEAMFERVRSELGRLDVFIANAAATAFRPLLESKDYNVTKTYAITVTGFVRCAKAAAELMHERGGSMVAVSGFDAIRYVPGHGVLGSAKASMETLVRYLAVELASRRVRVNAVSPGYIDTDSARLYAAYGGSDWDTRVRRDWLPTIPAGRIGTVEEVASVIAFLCSAEASYVTGQTLAIDGGHTLL